MQRRRILVVTLLLGLIGFLCLPVARIDKPVSTVLLDGEGRLLGARIAADEQWRFPSTGKTPERIAAALIAAEDKRFRRHPGVDPLAVGRAIQLNLKERRVVSGASTLTMQVIRISRDNPARTLPEKIFEAALALRLESAASKDTILSMYAHNAPFGGNTVGVEAASWRYFGRSAADLSWAEAATLAALPNSPGLIHPGRNRDALQARRDHILATLHDHGVISQTDLDLAKLEPLPGEPIPLRRLAPHLLAHARRTAPDTWRFETTLDADLQERSTEVVWRHHERLMGLGVGNAAVLMVHLPTGEVRSWVGNVPDFTADRGNHVDVVTAPRSTGSLLKPFLYAAMLESGELLPDQLIADVPMRIGGFAPENFDRAYQGALPASSALARSRNVPAAWMLKEHGVERFYDRLKGLGMTTLHRPAEDYGLSLILGGAEGTLWDLVGMYRTLGYSVGHDPDDEMPSVHWLSGTAAPSAARVEPAAAWSTVEALLEVNRPGVHGAWRSFDSSRRIAWKTGTSMGFRDGWAIGVSPQWAVGVWVGNADGEGRPELTGYSAAAPVLFDLFDLVDTGGWFDEPHAHTVSVELCAHSGMRAGADCAETVTASVPRAGLRGQGCGYCERIHVSDGQRVHAQCAETMEPVSWFVLPPAEEWFYQRRHSDYRELPEWADGCTPPEEDRPPLTCVSPRPGALIDVPVELSGERGKVVFEAAHREPATTIHWHLDERYVGSTEGLHQVSLSPEPGEHRLTLVDEDGARVSRRFTVAAR